VAYAELRSALAAAVRQAQHTRDEHIASIRFFEKMWTQMTAVHVDESLLHAAGDLADRYELRGFDAIHLASALSLHGELGVAVTFWSFDDRLNEAAAVCGLVLA
jgi:predicted nucleic acid-binding protein